MMAPLYLPRNLTCIVTNEALIMNWQSLVRIAASFAIATSLCFASQCQATAQAALPTEVSFQTACDPPGFASKQFVKVLEQSFRLRLSQTGNFEPRIQKAENEQNKKNSDATAPVKCLIVGTVTIGTDYFKTHKPKNGKAEHDSKSKKKKKSGSDNSKASQSTNTETPPTVLVIAMDARAIDPVTNEILSVANTAAHATQSIKLPTEEEMQSENFVNSPFGELTTDAAAQIVTQFNAQAERIRKKLAHEPSAPPPASDEIPVILLH